MGIISLTMIFKLSFFFSFIFLAKANIEGLVCTNTSYYGDVEYIEQEDTCCSMNLAEPDCTTTEEKACVTVTETVCMASVTTESKPVDCPVTLVKVENVPNVFVTKKCETKEKQIIH